LEVKTDESVCINTSRGTLILLLSAMRDLGEPLDPTTLQNTVPSKPIKGLFEATTILHDEVHATV